MVQAFFITGLKQLLVTNLVYLFSDCLNLYLSTMVFMKLLLYLLCVFFSRSQLEIFYIFFFLSKKRQILSQISDLITLLILFLQLLTTFWYEHWLYWSLECVYLCAFSLYLVFLAGMRCLTLWFSDCIFFSFICLTPDWVSTKCDIWLLVLLIHLSFSFFWSEQLLVFPSYIHLDLLFKFVFIYLHFRIDIVFSF